MKICKIFIMNNFNHYYDSETTRQVISVIVLNEHNVLSRIVGLFSARGYNIDSLTVAPITDSQYSRMTIVTTGDKRVIDQIVKQLNKLIPVLRVNEHKNVIEKDTVLMKFSIDNNLSDIDVIARAYHGSIQNVTDEESRSLFLAKAELPRDFGGFTDQHKENLEQGNSTFASKYNLEFLVYYEKFVWVEEAIAREKELKKWRREKKMNLIRSFNPEFTFLNDHFKLKV